MPSKYACDSQEPGTSVKGSGGDANKMTETRGYNASDFTAFMYIVLMRNFTTFLFTIVKIYQKHSIFRDFGC